MSGKYVFSKALKELRFHHCQTSDHSNAIRYDHVSCDSRKCAVPTLSLPSPLPATHP